MTQHNDDHFDRLVTLGTSADSEQGKTALQLLIQSELSILITPSFAVVKSVSTIKGSISP